MKFNYDAETDSLYIDLSEQESTDSREVAEGVVLDFGGDGRLVGIDIDRASRVVSTTTVLSSGQVSDRPETLDRKVSKGCESTGFEETCRSGERRGQETLAEHIRAKY